MRISTMTYTLDNQPDLYGVEDFAPAAAAAGVCGLNWVTTYGRSPAELRQRTIDAGLEVSCFTFWLNSFRWNETPEQIIAEARVRFSEAAELGAPRVMIVPLPIDGLDDRDEARRRWIDFLPELLPLAQEAGTVLTIENYEGAQSPFVTGSELLSAQKQLPELRFTFDTGNAATGQDPIECARELTGKIEYVHFKDWRIYSEPAEGRLKGLTGRYYAPAPVGEGDVDLAATIHELNTQNYTGFADIEYVGREYPAQEAIRRAAEWIRSISDA